MAGALSRIQYHIGITAVSTSSILHFCRQLWRHWEIIWILRRRKNSEKSTKHFKVIASHKDNQHRPLHKHNATGRNMSARVSVAAIEMSRVPRAVILTVETTNMQSSARDCNIKVRPRFFNWWLFSVIQKKRGRKKLWGETDWENVRNARNEYHRRLMPWTWHETAQGLEAFHRMRWEGGEHRIQLDALGWEGIR
jgi:hypothetical protein